MAQLGSLSTAYNLIVGVTADQRITTDISNNIKVVRSSGGAFTAPGDVVTLKNVLNSGGGGGGATQLGSLLDVNEVNKTDGAMLQWHSANNEYQIDLVTLDAGEF